MVCGGNVVVYFQYIRPDDGDFAGLCTKVREALGRDEDSWLLLDISDETCWQMGLYSKSTGLLGMDMPGQALQEPIFTSRTLQQEVGGRKYYIEPLVQAGTVYIFGGGHVAQELVPVLSHVGFRCVVMDDREEFANREEMCIRDSPISAPCKPADKGSHRSALHIGLVRHKKQQDVRVLPRGFRAQAQGSSCLLYTSPFPWQA